MSDKTISGNDSELPSDEWLAEIYAEVHSDGPVAPGAALDETVLNLARTHHPGTAQAGTDSSVTPDHADPQRGKQPGGRGATLWLRIGSGFAAAAVVVLSVSVFLRMDPGSEEFESRNEVSVASEFGDLDTAAKQVLTTL